MRGFLQREFSRFRNNSDPPRELDRGRGRGIGSDRPASMPTSLNVSNYELFRKNIPGTSGTSLPIISNFFYLDFTPEKQCNLHKYRVDIGFYSRLQGKIEEHPDSEEEEDSTNSDSVDRPVDKIVPQILKKNYDLILDEFLKNDHRFIGEDVARAMPLIFTKNAIDLKHPPSKVELVVDGQMKYFYVKLHAVKESNISAMKLLDYYSSKDKTFPESFVTVNRVVLKTAMDRTFYKDRNTFYDVEDRIRGDEVDFVRGVSGTVRNSELGPLLNLHLRTGVNLSSNFVKMDQVYCKFVNASEGQTPTSQILEKFSRLIRNLKVFTTHVKRTHPLTYICEGILNKKPEEIKININGDHSGVTCSLREYFYEKYSINLKSYPLLKIKHRFVEFLPMELCMIKPNQFINNKILEYPKIQQQLLFKSTNTPDAYFDKICKFSCRLAIQQNDFISEFGLCLNPMPVSFEARVLNSVKRVNHLKNTKFFKPEYMQWALFSFDSRVSENKLKQFCKQLFSKAKEKGMNVSAPSKCEIVSLQQIENLDNVFRNIHSKLISNDQVTIVLIVIPKTNDPRFGQLYKHIKKLSETKYGFITQCINSEVFQRMPIGYHDNLLLKINSKLGGLNASFSSNAFNFITTININKTLIIGIDVASNLTIQDFSSQKSFVGIVSQFDEKFDKVFSTCNSQRIIQSVIADIGKYLQKHFDNYKEENGDYPDHAIIYRAGISRMDTSFDKECTQIKNILNVIGKNTTLTLILVNKMTDTRFALTKPQQHGTKQTFNVPSGTIVDNFIVDPDRWMFHLNSHFSPLGTSKPMSYWINHDDSGMNVDEIQQFTFAMCANSPRTQDMLALPVVLRNADLCAQRGRIYAEADFCVRNKNIPPKESLHPISTVAKKLYFV